MQITLSYKNIHLRSVLVLLAFILLFGAAFLLLPGKVHADDTNNYPWIRPDNWLSQVITSPTGGVGSGHIGVDVQLSKPGSNYTPCQNPTDTYAAACDTPGGYYKVVRYNQNSNDFPYGIFIENNNNSMAHYWARRLKTVYLEVYPYSVTVNAPLSGYRLDPGACGCNVVGGYQVIINDWKGGYSANIGKIRAASFSDSDVGKLNGYILRNGSAVKQGDVSIDWFAQYSTTAHSSTNFPIYSFASWPTNSGGYYTSGPVTKGPYHIYVHDKGPNQSGPNHTVECVGILVTSQYDRLDLELTKQHFGLDGPGRQCYDR